MRREPFWSSVTGALLSDGTGKDVTAEAVKVLAAAASIAIEAPDEVSCIGVEVSCFGVEP